MLRALLLLMCLTTLAAAQTPTAGEDATGRARAGYVFHAGRWRLPQEITYLQRAAALRGDVPAAGRAARVITPSAISTAKDKPARAAGARPKAAPRPRTTGTGVFTIRAQQVRLLGFDIVPVSIGGGQVRLQLPRTESIGIGTTVGVPLR